MTLLENIEQIFKISTTTILLKVWLLAILTYMQNLPLHFTNFVKQMIVQTKNMIARDILIYAVKFWHLHKSQKHTRIRIDVMP